MIAKMGLVKLIISMESLLRPICGETVHSGVTKDAVYIYFQL